MNPEVIVRKKQNGVLYAMSEYELTQQRLRLGEDEFAVVTRGKLKADTGKWNGNRFRCFYGENKLTYFILSDRSVHEPTPMEVRNVVRNSLLFDIAKGLNTGR